MAEHTHMHQAEYLTALNKHFHLKAEDLMTLNKYPPAPILLMLKQSSEMFQDLLRKLEVGEKGSGFWTLAG